jgi:hypothetical protein
MSGLDLIEEFGLGKRSVLVTSRWEEKSIISRCEKAGIKILPKCTATFKNGEFLGLVTIKNGDRRSAIE